MRGSRPPRRNVVSGRTSSGQFTYAADGGDGAATARSGAARERSKGGRTDICPRASALVLGLGAGAPRSTT